jgi:rubredoxin
MDALLLSLVIIAGAIAVWRTRRKCPECGGRVDRMGDVADYSGNIHAMWECRDCGETFVD